MSKLYSYTYMSLDGVIESPQQWSSPFFSDKMGRDLTSRLESASAMVLGRVTYEEFAAFWPTAVRRCSFRDAQQHDQEAGRLRQLALCRVAEHEHHW